MDGSLSLNPVVELRRLFEGLPGPVRRPIELVVFGGDLPRADVSRMRWMAAELRAKADAMNEHAEDAGNILAQEDSLGALGDRVRETLHLHQEGAAKLREEALALADQAHAAANDAEKTLCVMFAFGVELAWRIISTLAAAAAAGPAGQVAAAPVVESMLIEGRGRVALMRAGLEQAYKAGAAKTATRLAALGPHRFVLAVGTAAALPAGVDLGVQIAQVESGDRTATVKGPNGENPRGIDLKSVEAAAVSGAGGAAGGIAAGKVAPKLLPRLQTSRSALGLVQGVAGAVSGLGAAALVTGWPEHFEDVLASLLSGGLGGVVDVHRGVHPDLGSALPEVVDGGGAYVPPDPATVSLSKDAVLRLAGAPQGAESLTPVAPAPVDSTTPQLATSAVPGHATDAGASQPGRNLVSSGPPEATGDGQHQPDEAGGLAQRLADSESGEQTRAPDDRTNSRAGAHGQPGDHHSTARPGDRGSADHAGDREPGVGLPAGGEETSGAGARAGADVPGGSGAAQTGDPAQADDDGHDGARAHGGEGHDGGGAQAADVGNAQTRDGEHAGSGGGAQAADVGNAPTGDGEHAGSGGGVQAGDGRGGGGAHGADGGGNAHAGGPGAAQAAGGVASGAVSAGAGDDHSGSEPRQAAAHGGDHARAVGGGRSARAPVGDGMAGHEPAAVRPGRGPGKLDPPVQVGNASGRHGAGPEGLARVTAPKHADVPPVHEPPAVEQSKDAVPADVRPSVHDGPDRPAAELVAELAGLPSADPATKQDLTAEQQTQFKAAAKKALALYRLRHEELAAESWEQRRHAMEHGDRAESLLRYIDAMREGTGKTPRWNQIKAFLLGEHGFMRQMGTGQGKSMVGALDTLRQLSRGEPVEQASGKPVRVHHVITTTEVLANEGVREFAPMLRSLGYEVARWDPHNPPGETERPTVYYMTYDERATAELFDRPPPGKTATIDEADAVLVHNQTVHYQSDGQRELASEVEAAAVYRVRDFLKAVLRSRITTAEDLSVHLGEALHDGPLSVAESGAARPLSAEEVGAARTLTARLLREQPERCLDTVSRLWESHAGREFTAEETEMARAFLDVRAGRLKLNRDFQIFGQDAEKKIQILDEYGKPRSDPKIGTESRWFGGRHKMVEAMFGAPVYSDGTGSKQVTVEDVLGGYEHLHLMSGTLERTAAEIKENFPVEGGLAKVEDFGRSKLAGEEDRIFLTEPDKLRDAVTRVQQLQAEGRPVLVICPFNDLARKFSLMLTKADVEHTAIDARWFAEHRDNNAAEEHLLSVKDTAGARGAVTVGTGMLGRGFDVSISDEVDRLGGVHAHMLGRSPTNPDEDHQWSARAGRNGRNGSFCFNVAASDRLYSDAQQHGARVAVTHYRTALAEHAAATAEYTEAVRRVGGTDAARPGEAVQAARTKVAATAADVAAAEREMRSLTSTLQNDAADRVYLERAMRRANQAHAPPTAVAPAAPSSQTTVAPGTLHTEPGTVHTSADTGRTGADTGPTRSDIGHAGAEINRAAMQALHAGPDAVQPHQRGDRFARLAGWLGIPASVQAAAAVFDNDDADDPLSRLLERAGVSSAAVETLNQHLDHAPPAAVLRADALTDEQALNRLTPQRNRLAAELGWEPAQVAGAEGVRQVGAAVDTARAELAVLLDVPVTEVNAAAARDVLADAVARMLARTEIADDPATELRVLAASTYLAVTALLDLAVAIHQRSPKSCVNNGVTMMRVLYPDNEHAYHLPDDMPLRGHDAEATERAFGGAFRAFRSLDEAAESLAERPWGSQALVYKWMNKGEVESHLVLLVNASDRAEAPNLVVLDIAAAPGQAPITAADLAARPALLKKAVGFQQWRRAQQAFIDRLTEADRRVFAIEFDHKGEPLDRLSATRRSAVASQDPGLPPPSLWSSRAPPLRRNQFALAGHRPVGDGSLPGNSVRADPSQPDTAPSNVGTGRARPHDEPESRGAGADSIGHSGEDGDGEPHIAHEGSIDGRSSDAMSFLLTGDLPAERMTGPVVVPQQLLLTEELAVALSDALTERDQAVHRITDQVRELEHALAPVVGEPGTVDMVSLMGVRDELSAFLGRQLAAYAETAEGQRDQMIATLREITARPRLDERDIRVLAEMVPVKRNKLIASLPGVRDRYAQELRTAARVRLAELDSHRAEFFRADDAIRRLQRGIQGRLDRAAEVLYDRGSRRTVRGLLDGIDAMRSEISAARRQISVDWQDIPDNELAPLLSEITRGLRSREDAVEAVAAVAAPRHITMVVDDALRTVEKSAVSIFAESSIRGFVFRDHDARNVRAVEDAIARVRTMVRAPETNPDLSIRVADESAERRSDFGTFVDPADTLYLHFTPNIRAIATTGMIRSGAHDDVVNTTAAHSVGVHFIKPGDWQGTENFNMYVGYAGLRRTLSGTVLPDPLGAIVVMPLGAITETTPLRNEAKTTAPDEAHLASDATFRPLNGSPRYAYPLDDAYIIPCYSDLQVSREQRLIIDPDTGERHWRPVAEPIRDAFRRAGYDEAWIDRHVIELPERIAADPETRASHGEYDRTQRLIRQAQEEIKRRMAEDGKYTDRLVVPLSTEHGRQLETLDRHGATRQGYYSTLDFAIERLIVADRRPPETAPPAGRATVPGEQPRAKVAGQSSGGDAEQRARPRGPDGLIGRRPSLDPEGGAERRTAQAGTPGSDGPIDAGELGRLLAEHGVVVGRAAAARVLGSDVSGDPDVVELSVPEWLYRRCAAEGWAPDDGQRSVLARGRFRVSVGWPGVGTDVVSHEDLAVRSWQPAEGGSKVAVLADVYAWMQETQDRASTDWIKNHLLNPAAAPLPVAVIAREIDEVTEMLRERVSREELTDPEIRRGIRLAAEGLFASRTLYGHPSIGRANHLHDDAFELREFGVAALYHNGMGVAEDLRHIVDNGVLQGADVGEIVSALVADAWSDLVYGGGRRSDNPEGYDELRSAQLLHDRALSHGCDASTARMLGFAVNGTGFDERTGSQMIASPAAVEEMRQRWGEMTDGEFHTATRVARWVAAADLQTLSEPDAVVQSIELALEDLMSRRFDPARVFGRVPSEWGTRANNVDEALRLADRFGRMPPEGGHITVRQALVNRLRGGAGFTHPDSGYRPPDSWLLANRDMRRDHAAKLREIADRLASDSSYTPMDAYHDARSHAAEMREKYSGFRWQVVVAPGARTSDPASMAATVAARLPESDPSGMSDGVIDVIPRVAEITRTRSGNAPVIVVTSSRDTDGRPRLVAQFDYTRADATDPDPGVTSAELRSELAEVDCRIDLETADPLPEGQVWHRLRFDFSRQRILVCCAEWGLGAGGMATLTVGLCQALAEAGHVVTVRTGEVGRARRIRGVQVIGPRDSEPSAVTRERMLSDWGDLPESMDLVIVHDAGDGLAAALAAEERYPAAKLVRINHLTPMLFHTLGHNPQRGRAKLAADVYLARRAHLVAGLGPVLAADALSSAVMAGHGSVHELQPGLVPAEQPPVPAPGEPARILLLGRAEDPLKGVVEIARVVRRLRAGGRDVRLMVRGYPRRGVDSARAELVRLVGHPDAVEVAPRTSDRTVLQADIRSATAVVMPSRAEGFGLVAAEAIEQGVPVVVPSSSGVGRFLTELGEYREQAERFNIVEQQLGAAPKIETWAAALGSVLDDVPAAWAAAGRLQRLLQPFTRKRSAKMLVHAAVNTDPRPHRDIRPSRAQVSLENGHVVVRGEGTDYELILDVADAMETDPAVRRAVMGYTVVKFAPSRDPLPIRLAAAPVDGWLFDQSGKTAARHDGPRTSILQAFVATVSARGFGATTIDDVCRRARISPGAFLDHFLTTHSALTEAHREALRNLNQLVVDEVAALPASNRTARVTTAVDTYVRALAARPATARLLLVEGFAADPGTRAELEAGTVEQIAATLATVFEESITSTPARRALAAAVHGMLADWAATGDATAVPALRRGLVDLLRNGTTPAVGSVAEYPADVVESSGQRLSSSTPPAEPDERERILTQLIAVTAEQGYAEMAPETVQRRAGVSAQTYRTVFSDKQKGFEAACAAAVERVRSTARAAMPDTVADDPQARLRAAVHAYLTALAAHPDEARVLHLDLFAPGPKALRLHDRHRAMLAAHFDDVLEESDARTARLLASAVAGVVTDRILSGRITGTGSRRSAGGESKRIAALPGFAPVVTAAVGSLLPDISATTAADSGASGHQPTGPDRSDGYIGSRPGESTPRPGGPSTDLPAQQNQPSSASAQNPEGAGDAGLTRPSRDLDPDAVPFGPEAVVRVLGPDPVPPGLLHAQRGLQRQNEAAVVLARAGFQVEQHPDESGARLPDFRIEGRIFDCYSPTTGKVSNICFEIRRKVYVKRQADRIVVNLTDSAVDPVELSLALRRHLIPNLREVLAIDRHGTVLRLSPGPLTVVASLPDTGDHGFIGSRPRERAGESDAASRADARRVTVEGASPPGLIGSRPSEQPDPLDASRGAWLKALRLEQGKKQKDVAQAAGLTNSALSNIEKGRRTTLGTFQQVCRALGVEGEALVAAARRFYPDVDLETEVAAHDSLGGWVAAYRNIRGMTKADLARAVGVTPTRIGEVENGDRPPPNLFFRIARALDVGEQALAAAARRFYPELVLDLDPAAHDPASTGTWIMALRHSRNMTQAELARTAGTSAGYIAGIEGGEYTPSSIIFRRICRALEVAPRLLGTATHHFYPQLELDLAPRMHNPASPGGWIVAVRHDRDMTRLELAEAIGPGWGHLGHIETGEYVPRFAVFRRICEVLGIDDESLRAATRQFYPHIDLDLEPAAHDLGGWITALRNDRDMTRVELARVTGLSTKYLAQVENENRRPQFGTFRRICRGLGVSGSLLIQAVRDFYSDITADIDPAAHQSLGRWIAALRYDEGMTTTELARRVGMPRRSLSDVENDRTLPRLSKLRRLCQAQGVGGELLLEIVERFYADRYERSGYRDEEELFQRYVVTRVGTPAEREVKDEIAERFAWIPKAVARREDPAIRDEVEQVAWIGMLLAIGNHVPSASFAAHAWASCRGAILRYRLAIRSPDLDDRILRLDAPISDDRSGHSVVADSAPVRSSDTGFVRKVRAALADMDDAATAEQLVMLHLVEGMSFTRATQLLGLPADVAADVRAETVARLRRAFARRQPSVRTASEQNRPTPWTTAGAEPDQPPIPPVSRGDSAPGEGRTRPGEFIGSRPGDDAPVAPGDPGRAGADPTADLIGAVDARAGLPTHTPPRTTPGSGSLGDRRPSSVPEATVADPSTRDEPAGPDPIHATGEELAHWATQLSDHGLQTFLTRAQTETSAHIADLRRGESPALEAAIAAARVQTALVVEQLHRSAAGGSGSLLAAADAATNVFEVIGALHSADTRSASYIHDLDVLTRFPERLRAAAELGAARFVDGSNWARLADEYLVAGRDNGWDQELIQSLRVLPARAAEFTAALTGSDRTFGEAAGRYIPNAYRAAMHYLTRSHDTDQAITRLRELDHAVAAAVDRLGSTRAATEVGLSLLQLRIDIHAAIASTDGAIAPAMRSSAMQGLDHNPQLPQMIERIVLDLRALARHGSETPRPIRPTYTAHPITVQDVLGAYDEETSPVLAAEAFAVQDGTFIRSTGRSSQLLQTGSDGVSFAMDQWGRLLAAATHESLLHLISAMGDELAGWGVLFTDDHGQLDGPVRPYRLEKIFDPMGTAQLRDALTRGGLRLDDVNFDNEGQGKLWRRDAPPVSALFTMKPLGVLGSIESMFAVYDDGFWINPVRGGTTRSADEVRVPLILGPLRHEPGNIEVAVYRQGDRTMVRYRDPDPGPEPDRVAPVFAEFHQRMNRWVAESDGAEWHADTARIVHSFEQHLERSAPQQEGPDGYIGNRPSDSAPEPDGRQPLEEDPAVRNEHSMPDPVYATHQELTDWAAQLSDGELQRFLAEKQAEASAHVAAVHRGRPPAVDAAIGTARAQIALAAERWRRLTDSSTRPSSADAQTTADAATAVFHIIGALPMAATSPSAFTDDPDGLLDLLTRFPERLLTAAERDQATGADAEDWARRADAFLTEYRGGDWDSELIRSLRSLPAKAAEFAHALTGSDRAFGAAAAQYIPDAYRAALYFLTRTRDVAQAVDRLREVDHAVAAAVDRLGSSRPAADAGLSLLQWRIDIHEALAYAADAAASEMRSSTLLGLEKNPLLPQRVTRVVDDLTGLARHGSETPRLIRPAYASHPVTSEEPFTDDDYREAIGANFHPRVLGVHDGQFRTLQGTSFEPLRTGTEGISFVMDRWGRMVGENEHADILHVLAAMGDEAAAWGIVFTGEDGRPVGQLYPYALGGQRDPMCTTQLRDVLIRAGFDLTDTSFNNESLGRLWQGELPSLPDLFTMDKWGLLNSIEATFGAYDDLFWVRTDREEITQSPDEVRVPLTLGPLRRAPGHVDVVVYREGEHIIVQYRDGDPGAEPEQVAPVFMAFHERMTRWVSESDGVIFHPDTDAVVVTFVQPHDRPGNTQDRPDGNIGSRPPDSPADSNDSPRRTSAVFAPDTPASQVRASLAESLTSLEAGTTSVPTQLLDVAASLVNYGLAAAGGDSVEVSLSSRDDDNGITVVGTLLGSTVVRARRALESELLGKGFGTFEWRTGETESWSVHLWATRESIVHVDSAQLAGLATDFGADQVRSAVSAAVGRASRRWGGLKYTGALTVEVHDGRLRVRMLGTVPLEGLAYEPPTLFDATITPPGPHRPGGFIGSRPPEAADADGLFAELARNRAAAAAELRAAARQFGEQPPERGAEAAAIDAWQHAQKASAATIATLTGTNPSLVTTQISEVLNLLHRRLTALTRPEWDRLLSSPGRHLLRALGPWIGRSLRLEDDLQRATTLALEGTPDNALNTSNAERRTRRTRDLDDMLGRSATSAGAAANADLDLPQALERLAASTEETPTGHLLNALLDHLRFARLIQLTTTWMELDRYITKNFGRFETPEQSADSAAKEGDRPSGLIGNRPQDQSTPWSRSSNRTGASDPADSTDRPEPSRTTPWSRPTDSSELDGLPDPTDPRFPHPNAWIVAARKRRKMSQKDLAAHIGLSVTQWGIKERASNPRTKEFQVSLEHARRALEALAAPENVAVAFLQRFFPEAAAKSGTDEPGPAHPPGFIGSRPPADETNLRTGLDKVAETPDVKQIQAMRGRPGVTIELWTFDDKRETKVLRETYDDVDQAMAEWMKALIGQAMGAPIAEVSLEIPIYHVLYRDYVAEGALDNPRAVDMLGLFAAITGKTSPFAAAFVRHVNGRRVWQDHHLHRQDIIEIGRLVDAVGDVAMAFPPSISRTVLDTHRAAMSALREVAKHAPEHPLWMAGLDDEAQAKTRLVANFELDHPYIELSGLISPHIPEKTVREILGRLDYLLGKYRYAPGFHKLMTNIRVLKIDFLVQARATAERQPKNPEAGKISSIRTILTFSLQYAADPENALADSERGRIYGMHPSSAQIYADDVDHEFAHAIDQATNHELSDNLATVLTDAYEKLIRYGLTETPREWLSRLPSFAFEDSTKTRLDYLEAIAVGFADAEINGIIVGTPQWVIHEYVTKLRPPEIKPVHVDMYQQDRPEQLVEPASATANDGARREGMGTVAVQQLSEDDWRLDRELALRAIEDTPWAYRMTYQEAQAHTEQYWRDEIRNTHSSTFVAMRDGKPIGQIAARPTKDRPGVCQLCAIWVAPEARGTGVGDQLMQAQLQWLRGNGHAVAVLWTRADNTFMQDLAARHGFGRTGNSKLDPGRDIPSIEMWCDLT
ncbi:GNAT family N-acetyltransferase [Nocardia sp. NPDC004573]